MDYNFGLHFMVAHDVITSMDYIFRGASAIVFDLSKFGSLSGKKYDGSFGDTVCVCCFEKALSDGQLIDFGDSACPVRDCIEQLPRRQSVHSKMVSFYFIAKFLTALVTGQ